jgi:hypothetical protein
VIELSMPQDHVIPHSYLRSWCDPQNEPGRFNPYIWVISKDRTRKDPKPPRRWFTEADRYTIRLSGGQQNRSADRTLKATEDAFGRLRPKILNIEALTRKDWVDLIDFASAMLARPKARGDHFGKFFSGLHQVVENLEKSRGAEPHTSLETKRYADNAPAATIASTMLVVPHLLSRMNMAIFTTEDPDGFITSDMPCVLFDPNSYRRPPFYRAPSLIDRGVEVTLPLTPNRLLFLSYTPIRGYVQAEQKTVDELNRRTRFACSEYFVSYRGTVKDYWFDPGKEPEDSWEKSPEGIAAEEQRQRYLKAKAEWEASVERHDDQDSLSR